MPSINENFLKLEKNYLFINIAKKINAFIEANPDKKDNIIRMGIGDVTQPIAKCVIDAVKKGADEMGVKETFKGYEDSGTGYDFLKEAVSGYYKSFGVDVLAIKCDVSITDEVDNFVKEVKSHYNTIDILVNNAGITKDGLILRMKEEDFDDVLDVNLKGTFNTTKAVSSIMVRQKYGKIINISSVVGISGNAGQCNYAASKAGVIGFSKSVARELASRNINVNVVAPGYINTDMTKNLPDKVKEEIIKSIPMKKIGDPKEVANLVLFLSSNLSDYITGQVINVDGGMVMA